MKLGSTCFRFKPDGSRLEPVSGGTSGFGLALDDWGDRFLCTNQQHPLYVAPLSHAALAQRVEREGAVVADAVVTLVTIDPSSRRARPLPEEFARLFPAPA